jgi:hypothetical protein
MGLVSRTAVGDLIEHQTSRQNGAGGFSSFLFHSLWVLQQFSQRAGGQ